MTICTRCGDDRFTFLFAGSGWEWVRCLSCSKTNAFKIQKWRGRVYRSGLVIECADATGTIEIP